MALKRWLLLPLLGAAALAGEPAFSEEIDGAADGIPEAITNAPALPGDFAFTFSMPYGLGDEFPREPEEFDRMLGLLKEAGFNTVHCPYADWRVPLFEKHGMKMMVDVLAWKPPVEADIRRPSQRPKVKAMCESVRGSSAIWGYNLWNERLDWCGNFDYLDAWVRMLRTWDPTHPVWVGTYRYLYCENYKTTPGVYAWYDYPWARGMSWNFKMLSFYRGIAAKRGGVLGKWMEIEDYNRDMYSLNTAIAHGVKTAIWFIGGPYAGREPDKAKRWNADSHMIKVAQTMRPLYRLIGEMGMPYAVYSTPTRRTPDNLDKAPGLPGDTTPFPSNSWLQATQGEVLCGLFKLTNGADIAYVVNHNAWAWQGVVLRVQQGAPGLRVASQFDREKGEWARLGAAEEITLPLPPAGVEVFRFEPAGATDAVIRAEYPDAAKYDPDAALESAGKVLAKQGLLAGKGAKPDAVYCTETSLGPGNVPKPRGVPEGRKPFPEDLPLQVKQGEALAGFFRLKDGGEAVCFVNCNAHAWQGMLLVPKQDPTRPTIISEFDLKTGQQTELGPWNDLNFSFPPAGSAMFIFRTTPAPEEVPAAPPVTQCEWPQVERVVAIGDVHGDYGQFVKALQAARVMDASLKWTGGKTHLVQVGDVADRGGGTKMALDLLISLQVQAAKAGGAVHALLGNHELNVMSGDYRETTPEEFAAFGGREAYAKAMSRSGRYGAWLRGNSLGIRIGDVLFTHAALPVDWTRLSLQQVNDEAHKALQGEPTRDGAGLIARNGPTFYRGWADTNAAGVASQCDPVLAKFGARHAVIGHTVQPAITLFGGGRVIGIDTGMTAKFGGPASALVIEKGVFRALYPGQEPVQLNVDYPASPEAPPAREASPAKEAA